MAKKKPLLIRKTTPVGEVVRGAMLRVPLSAVDFGKIKKQLTIHPKRSWKIQETVELFTVVGDYVLLPRNYLVPWVSWSPKVTKVPVWSPPVGQEPADFTSRVELRDELQLSAFQALQRGSPEDQMLVLGCGRGKTVIALHYVCADVLARTPTLVVVPTNQLLNQWIERIQQHTTLKKEEIGIVGGGKRKVTPAITLGILNSVATEEFSTAYSNYFKLLIFDEAHRMGAPLLGEAARSFVGERLSLTATDERDDGREVMYRHHLGRVSFRDTDPALSPKVYFVETGVLVNETRFRGEWANKDALQAKVINELVKDKYRAEIVREYMGMALDAGRICLVLGDRVAELQKLQTELRASGIEAGLLVGRLPGESKQEYEDRSTYALTKSQICLATSSLAKEGLDRPDFDTLFILYPFAGAGRLRQSLGRILRIHPSKESPTAMIFEDHSFYNAKTEDGGRRRLPGWLSEVNRKMKVHVEQLGYKVNEVQAR